jgi:hypothetical protein
MIDQNRAKLRQLLRDIRHNACPKGEVPLFSDRCQIHSNCDDCYIDCFLELVGRKDVIEPLPELPPKAIPEQRGY